VVSAWGGFGLQAVIARKSVVHTQVPASLCPYSDILDENEVRALPNSERIRKEKNETICIIKGDNSNLNRIHHYIDCGTK